MSGQVAGNLCGDDAASGLGVGRCGASRRFPLNAVHVDHENTGQTGHRGIDVPRHAEVADHQLLRLVTVGQAAVYIGERNHWPNRAGAAHDHVGIREHRSQVVERESIGGHPQLADLLSELLCAGQGPVHDVDALDPRAYQMLGRQRAHRARPDDDRAAAGQAAELGVGHAERHRHDRGARRVDAGLGVHPLAHRQRALRQLVHGAADGVVGLGGGIRAADLAEHLLLADDRGVQPAGHREEMLDGRFGVPHVGVLRQVAQRHTRVFGQHRADHRQAAVERLDDGVDLDAVAGGQHHRLGDQRGLQHLVDDLGLIGLVGAQLLQHRHRRAAVRNPEKQHAHGFITTSSKVIVDQLGYQICSRLLSLRKIRAQPGLIDLPITVLGAIQQHHRQPITELRTQRGIPARGEGVDVGDLELEAQFVSQLPQPRRRARTDRAALTCEQFHLPLHPASIATPVTYC